MSDINYFPMLLAGPDATHQFYRWLFDIQGFVINVYPHEGQKIIGELFKIDDEAGTITLMTGDGIAPSLSTPPIPLSSIKAITIL